MLSYNYVSGTNVRDVIDVVSVMATYAAITLTAIISTSTVETYV